MREIAKPVIEADEVLVRMRAAGLHVGDCFAVRGSPFVMRLAIGLLKPKHGIPGFDGAGEVEAVGATVRNFRRGDAVFGQCDRACAEYAAVNQDKLALKPANLTFEQAAALPTSALAALHALRDVGKVRPGQEVLINGASGGVGTFAVQIAKSFGANVTGVCSTRNVEMVRSLGADHVIDYTTEDFTRGGRRYDIIFDNVENRSLSDYRRALTPSGTLILNSGTGARGIGMPVPTLIRPPTDATPVEATAEVGRARALPDDFLREASARLGIMSLVVAGLWVVGTLLGRLSVQSMRYGASKAVGLTLSDAIAAASVVASLGLFAYTRSAHRNPQRILNLGLVYMVLIALALGLTFHSGPVLRTLSVAPQISWIGAVILMFWHSHSTRSME